MRDLRAEAASLGASLLDRLAAELDEALKQTALRLEAELTAQGHPLTTREYVGGGHYDVLYTLWGDRTFNQLQLQYVLVKHVAGRLRDQAFVASGCGSEFATLKWFIGEQECPLSV
jgi:hypothetical protein